MFPRVFCFPKSRINENGGKLIIYMFHEEKLGSKVLELCKVSDKQEWKCHVDLSLSLFCTSLSLLGECGGGGGREYFLEAIDEVCCMLELLKIFTL